MTASDRRSFTEVFFSLIIISSIHLVSLQDSCKKENSCKCIFKNGEVLDLSALGREDGTPRFNISIKIEDRFLWNPCYGFNVSDGCTDVAICEEKPYLPHDVDVALGYQNDVTFTTNLTDRTVQLTYISKGDGKAPKRMSFISLECNPGDADNSTFEVVDIPKQDSNSTKYYFKLRSAYACAYAPTTEGTTTNVETTATTVTSPESTTTTAPSETTVTSPESTQHGETTESTGTAITTQLSPGTTNKSPTTSPNMSTVHSSTISSSIGTSVSTISPTTPKPKSHRTLTAVLICTAVVVVGVAVGVTLLILKRRGKICKPKEYDDL